MLSVCDRSVVAEDKRQWDGSRITAQLVERFRQIHVGMQMVVDHPHGLDAGALRFSDRLL